MSVGHSKWDERPDIKIPQSFELPTYETVTLQNGAICHFVKNASVDILRVELVFEAGKWFEHLNGAAYFTSTMMANGTSEYTSEEISYKIDFEGASLDISSGMDFLSITIHCLSSRFENLLPVLSSLIQNCNFPEKELNTLKSIQIQNLDISLKKTSFNAARQIRSVLFGDQHPYGQSVDHQTIEAVTIEDLKHHYTQRLGGSYKVFMAGNIDDAILDKAGQLPFNKHFTHHKVEDKTVNKQQSQFINMPECVQGSVRYALDTVERSHRDFISYYVLVEIFGGYFGSRLMQNIREDKGFSYGIYANITSYKNASYLLISADIKKDKGKVVVDEIAKEAERLRQENVSSEELLMCINHLKGQFLSSINSPFSIMDKYRQAILYKYPDDFYNNLFEKYDRFDPDQIRSVAASYLDQSDSRYVIVE